MKRLLRHDPLSGMKVWHQFDENEQKNVITYEGDAGGVLDQCKEDNNHADRSMKEPLVHVARVPPSVQMKWFVEHGVEMWNPEHRGAVNRLLDGPYKHLKRLPIMIGNYN